MGISTEKGEMMVTTEGQLLRTTTEVLEGEPTEISVPNIRRTSNLPNEMHNSKPMVLTQEVDGMYNTSGKWARDRLLEVPGAV